MTLFVYNFQATSSAGDWPLPLVIDAARHLAGATWNHADDTVAIGLSPDHAAWDDYGIRRFDAPPAGARVHTPMWQASSRDGSGVVTLVDPARVDILVPANVIGMFGVGTVNVGVTYSRLSDGRRTQLLVGRLPILYGVI